jgi:hypothetical protein
VESFIFDGTDVTSRITGALSGTFNTLHMGFTRGGSVGWTNPHGLVALKVSECEQTISNADYTVNFVDGLGNSLKSASVRSGVVGNYISLLGTDKDAIWVDTDDDDVVDTKYIYVSDNASTTEITNDGSASCNIVFSVAPTYSYSFKTSFGTTLASGSTFADETVSTAIPRYIMNSGTFYVYASAANNITYSKSMTVTSNNQEETVSYNDTGYDNVVYFAEAEDIAGMTSSNSGQGGARSSMCYGAYAENNVTATSLPAGKYTLTAYICGNEGTTFRFYAGNTSNEIHSIATTGSLTTTTSAEFNLTETTDIIIGAVGDANKLIDFIYIRRTGDATTSESVTITSAGWATYCSPYALDFSSSIANLTKAYLITGNSGKTLTLEQITGTIPANTGILLEGEGAVSIPVVASSSTDVSANILKGVTAPTVKDAESIYVLMNETPGVGFYKNNNEFTVGANTAYIDATDLASARAFYLFDDMTTGVNDVRVKTTDNIGEVYNLAGQRVAKPTKGLYIVNGKKVVIK